MRGRTEEQIIEQIKQYMESHPNACREHIKKALSVHTTKLDDLESKGLVKLPKKVKPGMNSNSWRGYGKYSRRAGDKIDITKITQNTYD